MPVRRTIRVVVREDQLAILPDDAGRTDGSAPAGKVVPMKGDTVESLDEFVKQVREHIDGWGMAGDGLYWRPVLVLNVGPTRNAGRATWPGCSRTAASNSRRRNGTQARRKARPMKRVEIEADQMPGQDSFLDVITNIVGILILLVLVVGLRTSRSVHEASNDDAVARVGQRRRAAERSTPPHEIPKRQSANWCSESGSARHETAFREE